jgi:hypothetical protein
MAPCGSLEDVRPQRPRADRRTPIKRNEQTRTVLRKTSYPLPVHSLTGKKGNLNRPFKYLIVLAANNIYLPIWAGVSLVCIVSATILSGLAREKLLGRRLSTAGWWVLGVAANRLLFLSDFGWSGFGGAVARQADPTNSPSCLTGACPNADICS